MEWLPKFSKLDTEQQDVIRKVLADNKNHFITGYPGTGKSVVLAHVALQNRAPSAILTYTNSLVACIQEGIRGLDSNANIEVCTIDRYVDQTQQAKSLLLIDEAQDIRATNYRGIEVLPKIINSAPKLIFAADENQSIYSETLDIQNVLESCRVQNSSDSRHKLRINYRMTQATLNVIKALFPEKMDMDVATGSLVEDVKVSRVVSQSSQEEFQWIYKKAQNVAEPGKPSVILFKHHASLLSFVETILNFQLPQSQNERHDPRKYGLPLNNFCKENNYPVRFLGNSIGSFNDSNERAMIYLMTCHSAKGLDFENVFIPMCEVFEEGEKLFYVAISRSRRRLFLSGEQRAWMHERLANNTSVTVLNAKDVEEDEDLF